MSAQAQPTGSRPDARLQRRLCNYNETGGTKGVINEPEDESVDTECRTRESRRRKRGKNQKCLSSCRCNPGYNSPCEC
ncbi:hypothetical protein B0H65DRAFT_432082 [Neurospora tetraspora]|uniref:Uncharacterized protein n=1 Tax=Neurospora tetraspora TaxID=94610 RepID=A0AAE0JB41_9PEZI|nr:hypothetical protein B0H65DRAFT_432082 [Neurospora tetraspora]